MPSNLRAPRISHASTHVGPRPSADRDLPVRGGMLPVPSARTSVPRGGVAGVTSRLGAGMLVASLVAGLHAAWGVRRMRRQAAQVRPLVHDVDLPGRFPPRFLVMLGDSAAAGHGLVDPEEAVPRRLARALLAADGRATAVRSVAVDGANTADVLATQVEAARGAEVVLLGVGANDALDPRRTREQLVADTDHLLRALREVASKDAQLLINTCPDLSAAPGLPAVLRPVVGWRCRRTAEVQMAVAALHGIPVLDLPRAKLPREVFGADGFHPGAEGHAQLTARALDLLADAAPAGPAAR